MKKSLVSFRQKDFYLHYFLPFIEALLTLKMMQNRDLVLNKLSIAEYFKLDRRDVANFLKQAEADGLIKFLGKVRKFDDVTLDFAVCKYMLPEAVDKEKYYSKLQEFINGYMLWEGMDTRFYVVWPFFDYIRTEPAKQEKSMYYLEKYPWTAELVAKINQDRPEKLESRYLDLGKLRENNFLCSTLNPKKPHLMDILAKDLNYRYNVLTDYLESDKFIECDTNASIYRLSYNLNHDELLSHNKDVYAEFWELANFNIPLDSKIRDHLKTLCMPIYMSNAKKNGYNSILVTSDPTKLSRSEDNRRLILKDLIKKTGCSAREILDRLAEAMYKFIGTDRFLESEIFIHESNLHLLILEACKNKGIKTINVYDCFYFVEGTMTQDQYYELYDDMTQVLKQLEQGG